MRHEFRGVYATTIEQSAKQPMDHEGVAEMKTSRRVLTTLGAGLVLMLLAYGSGAHEPPPQTTYSGSATGIDINVNSPPVAGGNINFAKTQEYSDEESFSETQQHSNQTIGPFPDSTNNMASGGAGEIFAMTEGGTLMENVATSMAVITNLSDFQISPDSAMSPALTVNADIILSNSRAECIPSDPSITVSGGALIGNLDLQLNGMSVTGGPVTIDAPPNTTIFELPGVVRVIANEQVVTGDSIEITALHIVMESEPFMDVKLSRSKSDISSCPPKVTPKPGERMEGKGAIRWPDGTEAFFCYWCAIDAEGEVAGNLYLFDNSENGVEVQNWWSVTEFVNPDGSTSFPLTRRCTFEDSNVTANAGGATTTETCLVTGTDSGAADGTNESAILDCESYDSQGPLEYGDITITPGSD
ncbi:hypothetical protein FHR99_000579 [Litorivivens lipolytica]|uniref:Uncharacterized protein n=1 Tax=Litorivivens lipolytica TaxID=1524264 RepID=A0A7W4W2P6_9GAMM|nr:choice-of-anchor P family protein [Litorivivens lipolytica]MBB3046343.1 hypothetical protein [Litorivivens lipolytica]